MFRWLEACMSSPLCSVPFTVAQHPPADQNSIDSWMLVVDYQKLNEATIPDAHLLPYIEDKINKRDTGSILIVLDLNHGFHETLLAKPSCSLTDVCTPLATVQ